MASRVHKVFKEIAVEYPEIQANHMIIDIGTALLADQPEKFDVIVTSNLYGDIISDVAAQIAGSVGLAGSVNIGETCAMFEAIHDKTKLPFLKIKIIGAIVWTLLVCTKQ